MSSDESQSKAHFDLQSLGENKTGYVLKREKFPQMKTSHICLHCFFYASNKVLLCKAVLVRYQLVITFMSCCCCLLSVIISLA